MPRISTSPFHEGKPAQKFPCKSTGMFQSQLRKLMHFKPFKKKKKPNNNPTNLKYLISTPEECSSPARSWARDGSLRPGFVPLKRGKSVEKKRSDPALPPWEPKAAPPACCSRLDQALGEDTKLLSLPWPAWGLCLIQN